MRTVVYGPPGAGKTTYVEQQRKNGDLVWDWDAVSNTLFGNLTRQKTGQQMRALAYLAAALRTWLATNDYAQDVWIIVSDRNVGDQIARQIKATTHAVEATKEECLERVRARDSGREYLESRLKAIEDWFNVGVVAGVSTAKKPKRFAPGHGITDLAYEQTPWRKEDKAFYNSPAWRQIRKAILLRDLYTCQACGGMIGLVKGDAHVDHKLARHKGGTDDESNLQALCSQCHSRKTVAESGGFGS